MEFRPEKNSPVSRGDASYVHVWRIGFLFRRLCTWQGTSSEEIAGTFTASSRAEDRLRPSESLSHTLRNFVLAVVRKSINFDDFRFPDDRSNARVIPE